MIRNSGDAFVRVPTRRSIVQRIVIGSLNDMIEVGPHTVTYNSVPIIIPVNTPGINHAGCIRFPNVTGRMIAPHSPVKPAAFFFGSTRFTKERPIVTAVSVVEPTIRTPRQAIGDIVPGIISSKAIKQHHWFAIGHPIVILIWDEIKVGQRHHPHTAKAHFDTAYVFKLIIENDALVVGAIAISIL